MAGEARTCTNCGNQQATGAFCERCGTRLPALGAAQPTTTAPPPAAPKAPPAPQQAAPQQAVPQEASPSPYQYAAQPQRAAPRVPVPFSKLFDLSFQGFVTRDSLRPIFTATLVLLGIYWVFALIFGVWAAARMNAAFCIGIFSSLVLVTVMIIWTRIMMELTMTVSKMREDIEKAAQETAQAQPVAAKKPTPKAASKTTGKTTTKTAAKTGQKTAPKAATKAKS